MPDPAAVTVRVPAKVNLHLRVGSRRPDGYHGLTTVFQAVSLYDEVTVEPAPSPRLDVHGEGAGQLPRDGTNLALRAVHALAARTGRDAGVHVTLRKGIPVAGGMAGGSADAAAALVGADALWGTRLGTAELVRLAADLGSDVAFALLGGTALGTGRGERLSPVLSTGRYHWVFALAAEGLATPQVYAELDRMRAAGRAPAGPDPAGVLAAVRTGDAIALGRALGNDLQPAALRLRPALRRVLAAGRDAGAVGALVSGSGPTVALLARSADAAVALAAEVAGLGVCRTVRQAHGPVEGATVSPSG